MPTEVQTALGCSKCRFSSRGCKRCKDPAFRKRRRESDASASRQQRPTKRHKASSSKSNAAAQSEGKAPPAQSTRGQARPAKQKDTSMPLDSTKQPQKAPPPEDGLPSADQHSAPEKSGADEAQQSQAAVQPDTATNAGARAIQPDTESPHLPEAAIGIQHQPHKAEPAEAALLPQASEAPQAAEPPKAAKTATIAEPDAAAQVSPRPDPSSAAPASTAPEPDSTRSIPSETQTQAPAGPSAAAAAAASPQPESTPGSARQQHDKAAALGSQGTASDSSRPSFLAMLQSKMDKRRQERRESQSAGSASDSSMSSVHAAGASSAGKAGASVDSGTQAPQAMHAPRHKVKQQKRRSTKKAPAKTRAFLQRGPDPRQALWHPPASPYGLIEEYLYEDPWKLLVACMLLNVTSGFQVRKVIWKLFEIWSTAEAAAGASDDTMVVVEKLIQPLGLFRKRTIAIKRFSQEYLETDWLDPFELHGIGQYASDAYFMFCRGNWQDVEPSDKDLLKYQRWLHSTGGEGTGLERDAMPEAASASKVDAPSST